MGFLKRGPGRKLDERKRERVGLHGKVECARMWQIYNYNRERERQDERKRGRKLSELNLFARG